MKRLRRVGPLLFFVLLAVAVASCGGGGGGGSSGPASQSDSSTHAANVKPSGAGQQGVSIRNFKFAPGTITVRKGDRITIANQDSTAHTVTSDNGSSFDTGDINPGSSSTITVNTTGRIAYHCSIHPFMHGTVVVRGAKAS
jgi:plastocyanin